MKKKMIYVSLMAFMMVTYFIISCTHELPLPTPNACNGTFHMSYVATADTTNNGHADGTILAAAVGGNTITYSINGGAPQSTGLFTGLAAAQT